MRTCLTVLIPLVVLAGCRPETARPVPVEEGPPRSTVSAGTEEGLPPAADAASDGETMSPEKAREAVGEQEVESTGILKVLKESAAKEKTPNVLSPGGDFDEEEMRAIDEALGTLEKKPPPPLEKP